MAKLQNEKSATANAGKSCNVKAITYFHDMAYSRKILYATGVTKTLGKSESNLVCSIAAGAKQIP